MERSYVAWESGWAFFTALVGLPGAGVVLAFAHSVWDAIGRRPWAAVLVAAAAYAPFVWLAYRIDRASAPTRRLPRI